MGTIPEKDAGPVRPQQFGRRFGHLHQQRFGLARLVPLVADLQDRFQAADAALALVARSELGATMAQEGSQTGQLGEAKRRAVNGQQDLFAGSGIRCQG